MSDDLFVLHWGFVPVLVGERVRIPAGDVPTIRLVDDPVGGKPAALDLLGAERDHVTFLHLARNRRRDGDEAVPGSIVGAMLPVST
ncbi:hypothetical protein ACFQL0_12805 [Haloplanus litoreus]|uniref:hypothetical protein n=1 Tax=Haloplanus litoreus TaxID=767515 RepID=UPI003622EA3C